MPTNALFSPALTLPALKVLVSNTGKTKMVFLGLTPWVRPAGGLGLKFPPYRQTQSKPSGQQGRGGCFSASPKKNYAWISQVRPLDSASQVPPKIISFGEIKYELQHALPVTGNLVELWSLDHVEELRALWTVYEQPGPLTAILCGKAKHAQGAFSFVPLSSEVMLSSALKTLLCFKLVLLLNLGRMNLSMFLGILSLKFTELQSAFRPLPISVCPTYLSDPTKPDAATHIIQVLASSTSKPACGGVLWRPAVAS